MKEVSTILINKINEILFSKINLVLKLVLYVIFNIGFTYICFL